MKNNRNAENRAITLLYIGAAIAVLAGIALGVDTAYLFTLI